MRGVRGSSVMAAFILAVITAACGSVALAITRETKSVRVPYAMADVEMHVSYSWPRTEADLDTKTTFRRFLTGYLCAPDATVARGKFLAFSGDTTCRGDSEWTRVKLGFAQEAGWFGTRATVKMHAGWHRRNGIRGKHHSHWFGRDGEGNATLTVTLLRRRNLRAIPESVIEVDIAPGRQRRCANTFVAIAFIKDTPEGVTLIVSNDGPPFEAAKELL